MYKLRGQIVEAVFGQIKDCRRLGRFLLRGLVNVKGEFEMWCLTPTTCSSSTGTDSLAVRILKVGRSPRRLSDEKLTWNIEGLSEHLSGARRPGVR